MAVSSFRSSRWDPILIIAQIAALQSIIYIILSIILLAATILTGTELSLDLIFVDTEIRADTGFGWTVLIVWMVSACASIPLLVLIVQRAKQILDFVLTFHFFHLIFVWKVSHHFPISFTWWVLQIVDILIMTLGGEWACMHREMKPIMIHSNNSNTRQQASGSTSIMIDDHNDDSVEIGKKKRKTSDANVEDSVEPEDKGSLLTAMSKAKKALSSGHSGSSSSHRYDVIPMKDIDAHNEV
ncbi:hypothetical protein RMATCC62417_11337 [Rhizopus microsporus]|nr:hypothetical protein RMATCC62417_11337 [Rhizopus microsporus]